MADKEPALEPVKLPPACAGCGRRIPLIEFNLCGLCLLAYRGQL